MEYLSIDDLRAAASARHPEDVKVDGLGVVQMRRATLGDWAVITDTYEDTTTPEAGMHLLCLLLVNPELAPGDESFEVLQALPSKTISALMTALQEVGGVSEDAQFRD